MVDDYFYFYGLYQVYFLRSRNQDIPSLVRVSDCIRSTFLGVGIIGDKGNRKRWIVSGLLS